MPDLLFLCHRIPYPPNKGEKIRAFRILEHLARRHTLHVGCFVDDAEDYPHEQVIRAMSAGAHFERVNPHAARAWSMLGLMSGSPLSIAAFRHPGMMAWVAETVARVKPDSIFLYSSAMAQYLLHLDRGRARLVMDFVDVDSDKWRQYADAARWPMSTIYRREARTLLAYDRQVASFADASVFVSRPEADLFKSLAPESAAKIFPVSNGIDAQFFSPDSTRPNPYPSGRVLVFTGTMDYRPNVDAVVWFAAEILPLIRERHPDVSFAVVGAKPSPEVQDLGRSRHVIVTGKVADVRPYIEHAAAVVAPLRLARGIQNKVLEGMAMAKAVITTPQGLEGIDATPSRDILVGTSAAEIAASTVDLLARPEDAGRIGVAARETVLGRYDWAGCLAPLDHLIAP